MGAEPKRRPDLPQFDAAFRERLHELLAWRRDVRRFRRDPLPPGTIEQLTARDAAAWQNLSPRPGFRVWRDDHASLLPLIKY